MTATPQEIARFCDNLLALDADKDDDSLNGLQVDGRSPVSKIAAAVDACMDAFVAAKNHGCQMLVCHHGIYWRPSDPRAVNVTGDRLKFLFENGVSLWASHIPLDRNLKLGNNAALAKIVGIKDGKGFGTYHGAPIGLYGNLEEPTDVEKLMGNLSSKIEHCQLKLWAFGDKTARRVGVVSGGGAFALKEAKNLGLDTYVTGEATHSDYHFAKELGINVIQAGHWATETLGVLGLLEEIKKNFGIETTFLSIPTGL